MIDDFYPIALILLNNSTSFYFHLSNSIGCVAKSRNSTHRVTCDKKSDNLTVEQDADWSRRGRGWGWGGRGLGGGKVQSKIHAIPSRHELIISGLTCWSDRRPLWKGGGGGGLIRGIRSVIDSVCSIAIGRGVGRGVFLARVAGDLGADPVTSAAEDRVWLLFFLIFFYWSPTAVATIGSSERRKKK